MKNGKKFLLLFPLLLVIAVSLIITGRARSWTNDLTPPILSTSPVLSTTLASPTLLPAPTPPATSTSITLTCNDTNTGGSDCASISYNVTFYSSGYSVGYSGNTATYTTVPNGNVSQTFSTSVNISEVTNNPYVKINATATDGAGNSVSASYYFVFTHTISGNLFVDYNNNGIKDAGVDINYTGATIKLSGASSQTTTTDANGNYLFTNLAPGDYTVTLTNPTGYTSNYTNSLPNPCSVANLTANNTACNFSIAPYYSVTGTVFVDTNKDKLMDNGENGYTGGTSIIDIYSGTSGCTGMPKLIVTTSASTGIFKSGLNLTSGSYTVCYANKPSGYNMTYPVNGPPPSAQITLGKPGTTPACDVSSYNSGLSQPAAQCDANGDITGLNFGISNLIVWEQCVGADCSLIGGNTIPSTPLTSCSAGSYAIGTNNTSTSPGVYFGETPNPSSAISSTGWIAANPYGFSPVNPSVVRTSYGYIQTTLSQAGITAANGSLVDLSGTDSSQPYCAGGVGNCTLETNLPNGVYIANPTTNNGKDNPNSPNPPNDFVLNSYTFPTGKNYVILVNGDLYINGNILVPNGSTATFYVSGNIVVAPAVGEPTPTKCVPSTTQGGLSTGCGIEGFYSTDNQFIIQGVNNCASATKDLQLNIAGAVVINASDNPNNSSIITNQRDLCANDQFCPTYTITERPDMILNAPALIKHTNYTWQEVAP